MAQSSALNLWYGMFLAWAACFALGCDGNAALSENADISWDSPKMREVEGAWKSLWEAYRKTPEKIPGDPGKDKFANLEDMIDATFRRQLTGKDLRQLAKSPSIPDRPAVNRLLEYMARTFIDSGDRESLILLLSTRCPETLNFDENIEFYLAFRGKKLKDPILVLGEAYARCEVPDTRRKLAAAVRRGFAELGVTGQDDAEYVKNAMQWYEQHKTHLVVNPEYARMAFLIPPEAYEKRPELYEKFPPGLRRELLFKDTRIMNK